MCLWLAGRVNIGPQFSAMNLTPGGLFNLQDSRCRRLAAFQPAVHGSRADTQFAGKLALPSYYFTRSFDAHRCEPFNCRLMAS